MSLRRGQRFTLNNVPFRVAYVNWSRAHCIGETKTTVTVTDRSGKKHTFARRTTHTIDISPDTDIPSLLEALKGVSA